MGDIEETPTARKGDTRVFTQSNDSPATEVGGVTVATTAMQAMSMSDIHRTAETMPRVGSTTTTKADQKPFWSGPKQAADRSVTEKNPFGGQAFMSATAATFKPEEQGAYGPVRSSLDMPVIVSSNAQKPYKGKGKQPAAASEPIKFTTDSKRSDPTRHFGKIENVSEVNLQDLVAKFQGKTLQEVYDDEAGCLWLCFDDLRDAAKCAEQLSCADTDLSFVYISDSVYNDKVMLKGFDRLYSMFSSQVVFYVATGTPSDYAVVHERVIQLAKSFGDVLALADEGQRFAFRVEYFKISAAQEAVTEVSGDHAHWLDDCTIEAKPFKVWLDQLNKSRQLSAPSPRSTTPPQAIQAVGLTISPSGRTAWSEHSNGAIEPLPAHAPVSVPRVGPGAAGPTEAHGHPHRYPRQHYSLPAPQSQAMVDPSMVMAQRSTSLADDATFPYHALQADAKDNQDVHPGRIANGQDVRTTVMIRNLPNEWTCDDMKRVLDSVSWGKYDFAYLRIDFRRNMNVGYGFVNFVDATSIIPFAQKYQGRDWQPSLFNRKRGQISYATVQGLDCLIEKFRNSAIMSECPSYRPKLFFTFQDCNNNPQLIGREKPFPDSNNEMKKQRSHDNAGQVGLYAPRSGNRDNRARKSNWDKGTTRQLQEDASYYAHAGPAFTHYMDPAQAPIGTPMGFPFAQHAAPMAQQQFFQPYPQMDGGMGFNTMAQYPAPYPVQYGFPAGDAAGYGPYPGQAPGQGPISYNTVNHASNLRTMSNGMLAGRPRANVTVADPSRFDPAPGVPRGVPRAIAASGNADYASAANGNAQYGSQQYYTDNNGYEQTSGNGIHFSDVQY